MSAFAAADPLHALRSFQRGFAVRSGEPADALVARANAWWSHLAAHHVDDPQSGFDARSEIAWLVLDDALLAPEAPSDPESEVLCERRALFMALAPDREAWVGYLARFPAGPTHLALRARRAQRARLLHGAVHPDPAALATPPAGPAGEYVRRHLAGAQVCLACRRRARPNEPLALAAAADTPLVAVRLMAPTAEREHEVVVTCFDDGGELRARVEPVAPWAPLSGRWDLTLHAEEASYRGAVHLPDDALYGLSLGALPSGAAPRIHRIELHPLADSGG